MEYLRWVVRLQQNLLRWKKSRAIMESDWKKVKSLIRKKIPDQSYRMWIDPIRYKRTDDDHVTLVCANGFSRKRIQNHYLPMIAGELTDLKGQPVDVTLVTAPPRPVKRRNQTAATRQMPLPGMNVRVQGGRFLRKDFTFDRFVVGGCNGFAYSASLAYASSHRPGHPGIFLMSGPGLGKSHLSQAVGHQVLYTTPAEKVYYTTVEDFTNELVQSFKTGSINQFKRRYRDECDVLLLEDVQYLTGKERTQIELAHTLDSLYEMGKRVVFSGTCVPQEIPKLNPALRSRLSSGLITAIDPPDFKTRMRILKKKSETDRVRIPLEVLRYLAAELTADIRQLECGLNSILARAALIGAKIDLKLAEEIVATIRTNREQISIDRIKRLICKEYALTLKELISKSRQQRIVKPRQIAMYLARAYTDAPLQEVGRSFNRYHATALYAVSAVEKGIREEPGFRQQVELLRRKLETGRE